MRWWDIEPLMPVERGLFGSGAWSAETFWGELAQPSRCYLVAETEPSRQVGGPGPLGYGGVAVSGAEADVQTLAVAPCAQGCGLGGRLLTALLAVARERGAGTVTLEVRADNDPARALYARHGFERIAVRRRYYQPSGVDALVLRRRLTPGPPGAGTVPSRG